MISYHWIRFANYALLCKYYDLLYRSIHAVSCHKVCLITGTIYFILYSFGGTVDSYPHPELDFNGFLTALNRQNQLASKVWDPVSRRLHSWIRRGPLYRMHPIYICTVS